MKMGFYAKTAASNIRKNTRLYIPRILSETGLLGSFYILVTLALDQRMEHVLGGSVLPTIMMLGAVILGILSLILTLYVNSFLMKQRKSEYGLYNVLGLEKRHIIHLLFSESLIASLTSVVLGVLFGVLFYKLSSLLICRLLHVEIVAGFYYLSAPTVLLSAAIFLGFDFLAFLSGCVSILRLKPTELMAGRHTGEREPKIKWVLLLLGIVTLGAGYYIALTTQSPLQAIFLFFGAGLLIIIGTYCLFVTGTVFVLKCLKKNRRYYYDRRHMPAVAGLLFRMKQNAVGLASIAILAAGVLVVVSTTVSLYGGVQDTMNTFYPQQLYLSANRSEGEESTPVSFDVLCGIVTETADELGIGIQKIEQTHMLSASYLMRDDSLLAKTEVTGGWDAEEITGVIFITEDTYTQINGQILISINERSLNLERDEIAFCRIYSTIRSFSDVPETLTIAGREYRVAEILSHFPVSNNMGGIVDVIGVVVADDAVLNEIYLAQKEAYGEYASEFASRIGVTFEDEKAVSAVGAAFSQGVVDRLKAVCPDGGLSYTLDTRWETERNVLEMYGTFLFLGCLLGLVSLFATILIIYYKQISEGYEDRERFQIMEKVGMDAREVKKTIGSQLTLQFFLPLVTAAIHTAVLFPIALKLLKILMLTNTTLYVICTILTFAVFALVYVTVYILTARTYYRIVH